MQALFYHVAEFALLWLIVGGTAAAFGLTFGNELPPLAKARATFSAFILGPCTYGVIAACLFENVRRKRSYQAAKAAREEIKAEIKRRVALGFRSGKIVRELPNGETIEAEWNAVRVQRDENENVARG